MMSFFAGKVRFRSGLIQEAISLVAFTPASGPVGGADPDGVTQAAAKARFPMSSEFSSP
jgi:hypothetical protein